jgi:prepilin-type N-terminal cleavage/methylation domain-containing protein
MNRRAFTLVELLIVMLIILLVSVIALPGLVTMLNSRQIDDAARILQGGLVAGRDQAARDSSPAGIRLLPDPAILAAIPRLASGQLDPTKALVSNRYIPISTGPDYSEGLVNTFPAWTYLPAVNLGLPCLVIEQAPGYWQPSGAGYVWIPNAPTNWAWNIRRGEQIRLGSMVCTIFGPVAVANSDGFINYGTPGAPLPFTRTYTAPDRTTTHDDTPEFLLAVNGRDDDGDGYIDNGWDGVDNNGDPLHLIDEPAEWTEVERWDSRILSGLSQATYTIGRRPYPDPTVREVLLPASVVVDLSSWGSTKERSRVNVDPFTGYVDLMFTPGGQVTYSLPWGVPSSLGLAQSVSALWLCERTDIHDLLISPPGWFSLPMAADAAGYPAGLPVLTGYHRVIVLRSSGHSQTVEPSGWNPAGIGTAGVADPMAPYRSAVQGGQ